MFAVKILTRRIVELAGYFNKGSVIFFSTDKTIANGQLSTTNLP
jgi:hypothetical protein